MGCRLCKEQSHVLHTQLQPKVKLYSTFQAPARKLSGQLICAQWMCNLSTFTLVCN